MFKIPFELLSARSTKITTALLSLSVVVLFSFSVGCSWGKIFVVLTEFVQATQIFGTSLNLLRFCLSRFVYGNNMRGVFFFVLLTGSIPVLGYAINALAILIPWHVVFILAVVGVFGGVVEIVVVCVDLVVLDIFTGDMQSLFLGCVPRHLCGVWCLNWYSL